MIVIWSIQIRYALLQNKWKNDLLVSFDFEKAFDTEAMFRKILFWSEIHEKDQNYF